MRGATSASSSCPTIRPPKIPDHRSLGAELRKVPAVPYSNPNQYQKVAGRLAQELPDAIWANQFDNTANREAHFESTGPEIWRDTDGKIDAFCAATGTGGTLAGTARYLKSKSAAVRIVLVDPPGSALFHYIKDGELKSDGGSSITEGIGTGRVTANLEGARIDDALLMPDADNALRLSAAARRGPACSAAPRASTWRPPSVSPNKWVRDAPSSPCCATAARSTSPACSIRRGSKSGLQRRDRLIIYGG